MDARDKPGHEDVPPSSSLFRSPCACASPIPPAYRYEPPATGVIQILRMTPGSHDGQYVAEWQIDVSADSRLDMHQDAFGNVTHVLTHGPIADLTITVEGLIETHDTGGVLRGTDERFPPSLFCAQRR